MKIKTIIKITFACLLTQLWAIPLFAQQITATINKTNAVVGEQLQLTFAVSGQGSGFTGPDFKDFNVLGGPSVSNSISIVNGNYSQSTSYTYWVSPAKEGTFKIGPASITINNKRIQSNVINVTVGKGQPQQAQQGGRQQQAQSGQEQSGLTSKNVFILASIDKSSLYRGESMVVTFRLYTNVSLVNLIPTELPSFNGFWNNDIKLPATPNFVRETYNGTTYNVAVIHKAVLFPQQPGTLTIDPMKAKIVARIQVQRKRNYNDPFDIFNDPFFGGGVQDVEMEVKSATIKVNVKDLPAGGPASFHGAVGRLQCEGKMDKLQTKANEPVSLKIKISGRGNLQLIDAPEVNVPADIETYDPKVSDNYSVTESGASGSKSFEYLLIPRHEGEYIIDAIPFSYFDLESRTYRSSSIGPYKIKVARGDGTAAVISGGTTVANKSDVAVLGHDIRYIMTSVGNVISLNNIFYGSWLYYLLLGLPFMITTAAVVLKSRNAKLNSNITLVKSRGANKVAVKRLSAAGKLLQQQKNEAMYDEIYKAVNNYVSDKLSIPVAELNKENTEAKLTDRKVPASTIETLNQLLHSCEMARFTPAASANAQAAYNQALAVITKIENEIV